MTKSYYFPEWMYKKIAKAESKDGPLSHTQILNHIAQNHGFLHWKQLTTKGQFEVLKQEPYDYEASTYWDDNKSQGFKPTIALIEAQYEDEETGEIDKFDKEIHIIGGIIQNLNDGTSGVVFPAGRFSDNLNPDFGGDIPGCVKTMAFGQDSTDGVDVLRNYSTSMKSSFEHYDNELHGFSMEALFIWDEGIGEGFAVPRNIDDKAALTRLMASAHITFRKFQVDQFNELPEDWKSRPEIIHMYSMGGEKIDPKQNLELARKFMPDWPGTSIE